MGKPPHAAVAAQGSHTSPVATSGKSSNVSEIGQPFTSSFSQRFKDRIQLCYGFFPIIKLPLTKFTIEKNPLNKLKTKKFPGSL